MRTLRGDDHTLVLSFESRSGRAKENAVEIESILLKSREELV
jgi:hypothetical protein